MNYFNDVVLLKKLLAYSYAHDQLREKGRVIKAKLLVNSISQFERVGNLSNSIASHQIH